MLLDQSVHHCQTGSALGLLTVDTGGGQGGPAHSGDRKWKAYHFIPLEQLVMEDLSRSMNEVIQDTKLRRLRARSTLEDVV